MGKVGWEGPFPVMDLDPMIFGTAVYTSTILYDMEIIRKSLRAYMPRTYSKLLNHDVIVMADAYKDVFRTEHLMHKFFTRQNITQRSKWPVSLQKQ